MRNAPERTRVEEAASFLMARAGHKGAAGADVVYRFSTGHSVSLHDGQPEENLSGFSFGIGLRTLDKVGRQGIAHGNDLDRRSLEDIVDWSLNNCASAEPDENVFLGEPPFAGGDDLELWDRRIGEDLSADERRTLCEEMHREALAADGRVTSVRSASWSDGAGETYYASTAGASAWAAGTTGGCGVSVVMESGEAIEMGGYGDESRWLSSLSPVSIAKEAVRRTGLILGGRPLPTGRYDLVLDGQSASSIVDVLGELFLASNVHKGRSFFAESMGQAVGSDMITLVDDGLLPRGLASSPFDGEGMARRKTCLMRNGVVEHWLYNLRYAAIDGVPTTGNASRGISGTPDVSCSNLALLPGAWTVQDLVLQVGRGIYITELLGLHTINPVSGDFSLGIKGAEICGGEFGGAVSGMTIAGNMKDVLKSIDLVGNDFKYYGEIGSPSLVIRDVAAAGV